MFWLRLTVATTSAVLSAPAMPQATPAIAPPQAGRVDEAAFRRTFGDFVERLRAGPIVAPGSVVLVVHRERTVFERAYGFRNLATRAPMTLDTPVYNASVTKAYTGLLAAVLDRQGVLPLSASLADIWPALRLPAPLDPRMVTARRLLSHSAGVRDSGLVFRSLFAGDVRAADVPAHLALHATPGPEGFVYDNFGPFVWSAMAETRTGLPWRALLRRWVLRPMGLRDSSGALEAFPAGRVARCHPRGGGQWRPAPPKPTATMNAAGGMYTSGRDAARFLQAFLTDGRVHGGGIPAEVLRSTWQRQSIQDRTILGTRRDGYGLGWDLGTIGGHRFVSRSGGYAGCRAFILFLPELELGVVAMSNGDAGANMLHAAIIGQAVDYWAAAPDADAAARRRIDEYRRAAAAEAEVADAGGARLRDVRPVDPIRLTALPGDYRHPRLGGYAVVRGRAGLLLTGGALRAELLWVGGDEFLMINPVTGGADPIRFERDAGGAITGFLWDDDRFERGG